MSDCPKCGAELRGDAPAGLCPRCLVLAGFGGEDEVEAWGGPDHPVLEPTAQSSASAEAGFVPPTPAELASAFPQLEILALLGHGGMGAVYQARQTNLGRLVALKIIRPEFADDPAFAGRFSREARTLARLNHPNIVAVHDFGETTFSDPVTSDSTPRTLYYFLMEYVEGANVRSLIRSGELYSEQVLAIIPQICEALQFAHDEGVVHRDIKPENILVDSKGQVKMADFGLARLVASSPQDLTLTRPHQVMGTPRYMAPEQMSGSHDVDHRADIYSLGVVFYEMLTGEVPLGHFESPSQKASVDDRLDGVVLRALAADPDRRFQQAGEMKASVEDVSSSAGPSHDAGISTIVERELRDAWQWLVGGFDTPGQHHSRAPALLMIMLGLAGGLMAFLPWMHLEIDKLSSIEGVAVELEKPVSEAFRGYTFWPGVAAATGFVGLTLLVIAGPINKPLAVWRAIMMTVIAAIVLLSTLLFQREVESQTYPVSFVALQDDSGEQGDGSNEIKYYPAFLHGLDHQIAYRAGFWGSLVLSAMLLLLGTAGIRHAAAYCVESRLENCHTSVPPLTSLRFRLTEGRDIESSVVFHFSGLGYSLVDKRPNEWVFQRGNSWSGLWTSDIRALFTTLTVRSAPGNEGELLVSCVWAVRTLGAWIGGHHIRRLEAEGHGLESFLGSGEERAVDDSESVSHQFSFVAITGAALAHLFVAVVVLSSIVLWRNRLWFQPPVDWTPVLLHTFAVVLIGSITTFLGIVSIIKIRNSDGRMKGFVLAFIAAVLFPLLLLNAAIYGILYFLTIVFFSDTSLFVAMTPMLWGLADISYICLAWRIASRTGDGARSSPALRKGR